jgi:cytochrome c-type biogenesis protein CcsB
MKKFINSMFSTSMMGLGTILFIIAIATATFVENDYGTQAAQVLIYRATWFEFLLVYLGTNLIINIFRMKLFRIEKWSILTFHVAFLFILIGAGITRYISYEGVMHIREGDSTNQVLSDNTYINLITRNGDEEILSNKKVLYSSITRPGGHISQSVGDKEVNVQVTHYIPDAAQTMVDDPAGTPTLSMVIAGSQGRETIFIKKNQVLNVGGVTFSFDAQRDASFVNISEIDGELTFSAPMEIAAMRMADQEFDTLMALETNPLELRKLYSLGGFNFVINDFNPRAIIILNPGSLKPDPNAQDVVIAQVSSGDEEAEVVLWGSKGRLGQPVMKKINGMEISVSYGSKIIEVPFTLKLNDFQLERYPGSDSPSSFASEVTLIDAENNLTEDRRIFMNNVLNYQGYRFFQSSYDSDELGTVLSVNHDKWGTMVTYLGYLLLALGMIFTFFIKQSRMKYLADQLQRIKKKRISQFATVLLLFSVGTMQAQELENEIPVVKIEHAQRYGRLLVQDFQGRIEPMNTLASELIRKITGKEKPFGLTPEQMMLSMMAQGDAWQQVPMIKIKHPQLLSILGIEGKYASFDDFYGEDGYKIRSIAEDASRKRPAFKTTLDKEVAKIDEKVNITFMIFSADFLRIYPKPDDVYHEWATHRTVVDADYGEANLFVQKYLLLYLNALTEALQTNDWENADETLGYLEQYQGKYGIAAAPSKRKLDLEILYNESQIFPKLSKSYGLIGFALLVILFVGIFKPHLNFKIPIIVGTVLLVSLFLFHTAGLAVRWYISGHAPWSNGYESMIYIGWATVLAGFLFVRKSPITLAVTAVLSALILWVAGLSWLDPEVGNLVPVLKSYWLTVHVSIITSSYGFMALGALLAFFNLIVISVTTKSNKEKIEPTVKEITYITETTLQIGLFMLAIGTFLGGIWANESWGRYWGWDAKETWAFISVLVYTFILHMRIIPPLKGLFTFNFAALIGYSTIVMTYFGVNYYLSGLHSYAAGDPVPIPNFVYYTLAVITVISTIAYFRYSQVYLGQKLFSNQKVLGEKQAMAK